MKEFLDAWRDVDRNKLALLLSVVPGAGHLYKHHFALGLGLLLGGNILVAFVATLLAFATAGVSFVLVPMAWWAGVAASAYGIEDRHNTHHWLHPWTPLPSQTPSKQD